MQFTKMHGAGNDFIIINNMSGQLSRDKLPALAKKLCACHTSIGADGMMIVVPAENGGDYRMLFYNADGSLGEMCGNGARCICRYGYENGLAGETQRVETTAGLVTGERLSPRQYRIRLNDPSLIAMNTVAPALGEDYDCCYIELGNPGLPHAIVLSAGFDSLERDELRELGRALRYSPVFPKGANVSFVKILGDDCLKILTFERGVEDFTLACGTACGSAVVALSLMGLVTGENVTLKTDGGELSISLTKENNVVRDIFLTGPTNLVCDGVILDEDLPL